MEARQQEIERAFDVAKPLGRAARHRRGGHVLAISSASAWRSAVLAAAAA